MSASDRDSQQDELLALASIYDENEFKRAAFAPGGEIRVCAELPERFRVYTRISADASHNRDVFEAVVRFLPPLVLQFELPPDYPSASAPVFTLSCKWLPPLRLSALCHHLDTLWEKNQGSVVLFDWMQFLKEGTLTFLNITSPYQLSVGTEAMLCRKHLILEEAKQCPTGVTSVSGVTGPGEPTVPSGAMGPSGATSHSNSGQLLDGRAIQDVDSLSSLIRDILAFNKAQQKGYFDRKLHMCNICFCEKVGSECISFKVCQHIYCNACLTSYFEVQIKDGRVHSLNCPEPECSSVPTPAQVKELVGDQLFSRYDRLLLQSSLDLMADVVYCPRPRCETPVLQEPEGFMGLCSGCQYAFCTLCKRAYHGISPCKETEEKLNKLRSEYIKADEATKRSLEQRYGKRVIQKAIEEVESKQWLEKNSKSCPRCGTHIQKTYGCNKMFCAGCRYSFCWICMASLPGDDPYAHFNDPNVECYQQLFHPLEGDDDEEEVYNGIWEEEAAVEDDGL